MPKDSPCHYCTDRHLTCHSDCQTYKDWAVEYAESRRRPRYDSECVVFLSERNKRIKDMWNEQACKRYREGRGKR